MNRYFLFTIVALLFVSCLQEVTDSFPNGASVDVSLSFNLAEVDHPTAVVSSESDSVSVVSKALVSEGASASQSAPFQVLMTNPVSTPQLRSSSLTNVWVLQFDSLGTTGNTAGSCVAAKYIGQVTTSDNLNTTLVSGTNQVVYIIANGPAAGSFSTSTYTLATFKTSAYFSGSITGDATVPYIGRIAGGATVDANGEVTSAAAVPTITLYRMAAKVSLTLNFAVTGYTLSSVQMFNAPAYMYYLNGTGTTPFPATPSSSNITTTARLANMVSGTAASGTYIWYLGENKRGTSTTSTTPYLRDFLHTPSGSSYYCSYIRIQARKNDSTSVMNYYLYLGENATTDFNVKRNWDYSLNAVIRGNAAAQESYMGIDGRIRMATSNCYIVAPSGTITIPVNIKGNANQPIQAEVLAGTGVSASHTATAVSVLWQSASGLLSVGNFNATAQTVSITASSSTGNGVIVAKDASNNVLWSWHIWVTSYNPKTGTQYNFNPYNSLTFMDRNLGATTATAGTPTTAGLLYQWGRKDPFPGTYDYTVQGNTTSQTIYDAANAATSVTITTVGTTNNLSNSILNPMTLYTNTTVVGDWYTTTAGYQNEALWGGASVPSPTAKTVYDPCPVGWRVPAWRNGTTYLNSPWGIFGDDMNNDGSLLIAATYGSWANCGMTWSNASYWVAGYWPGAGYRTTTGDLTAVGTNGSYWTATKAGTLAYYILIYSNSVYPQYNGGRSIGLSVRCVKEF